MPVNEYGLVGAIQKAVRKAYPNVWQFKVVGSPYQMSGVPDLLFCVHGLLVGAEAKFIRPGESHEHAVGRATSLQKAQISRINTAGGVAAVVTSVEETLDLIRRGLNKHELEESEEER